MFLILKSVSTLRRGGNFQVPQRLKIRKVDNFFKLKIIFIEQEIEILIHFCFISINIRKGKEENDQKRKKTKKKKNENNKTNKKRKNDKKQNEKKEKKIPAKLIDDNLLTN